MKRFSCFSLAAFALSGLFLAARPLDARELAGVTLPDTLSAGEKTLNLNGLGLRRKAVFKVYVGGLYLEAPSKDAAAIVAADAPKAIRMHFLRDLKKTQLTEAYAEGFAANAKEKAASQKASIDKMLALIPDVKEGETMSFVYVPGKGTTLYAGEKALGTFEGKDFADAVFSIWLGPKPPSEDLKKGMLG
ncbi:MAG: chalcone isomerase family protein [Thermoanaerobaculia bacterium]|nr:chalcone isomerase family protein [Thermoanaerobaculia bacterium]